MKNILNISVFILTTSQILAQPDPYLLKDFKKVNSPATCVSFSADGKSLVTGYNDGNARLITIEDGSYGPPIGSHWKGVKAAGISADGKLIFTAGDNTLKGWTSEGLPIYVVKDMTTTVMTADLDSSGRYIVAGEFNRTFKVYNAQNGSKISEFRGHTDVAMTVCFNHDGSKIASADGSGHIKIWDRESKGLLAEFNGQAEDIYSITFSEDDKYLASASKDKTINIYNIPEKKLIRTLSGHSNQVMKVEFSKDGLNLLSCSFDQSIRLWELSTGKCIYTYIDHEAQVMDVTFSPDGKTFASASFDQTVKLWKFSTDVFVDYYYSPQVIEEMEAKEFLPKQKGESRDNYDARKAKAAEMKKEIYERYYQKYLLDLKNGTLPTI